MENRWQMFDQEPDKVRELSQMLNCHPVIASILVNRNLHTAKTAADFLNTSLNNMPSPFSLKDMDVAVNRIYNAITDSIATSVLSGDDPAGHGSHVASIAVSSLMTADATARYNGVAPGAHLVSVQAFDENGNGTYADVVRAIDWVVTNRKKHKIRIINASFSAEPRSYYWDDPINQAIMVAWQNEIFVVAAAGNRGFSNDLVPHYPSSYEAPNVIAVMATNHDDERVVRMDCLGVYSSNHEGVRIRRLT